MSEIQDILPHGTVAAALQPAPYQARFLCRRAAGTTCPHQAGGHRARVRIEDGPHGGPSGWRGDDSRWPRACVCGHRFGSEDEWDLLKVDVYLDAAGRECNSEGQPL